MYPDKYQKVPSIIKDMDKAGYSTSFYYGGSLDFANLRSYFISSRVQTIITGDNLSKSYDRGKWGVHDKPMFAELFKDLQTMKQPFFTGFFTLSSHEPFDLPEDFHFGKNSDDQEYLSAAFYTDKCLGQFMESLRKLSLWQNTLVVIVADHGIARMEIFEAYDPEKYHIPMVWTGGVIKSPQRFEKVCSQTDIPLLILNQCCVKPNQPYIFSNEIDKDSSRGFAAYLFNNGVGFVTSDCVSIYNHVSGKYDNKIPCPDKSNDFGKAYLQVISSNFNNLQIR